MEDQNLHACELRDTSVRGRSRSNCSAFWSITAILALSACGGGRPTEMMLPGGIPASTNLHEASDLPPESVRTVARREFGWRLIFHPSRAPASAEQGAARALCGLERRAVQRIERVPRTDPSADYGAAIIDIYCA